MTIGEGGGGVVGESLTLWRKKRFVLLLRLSVVTSTFILFDNNISVLYLSVDGNILR